jgi:hypothetical protein
MVHACKAIGHTKQPDQRKPKMRGTREAINARGQLAYHVRKGHIRKPSCCENCGKEGRVEGAHDDYKLALQVRWLCVGCHRRWDKANPKGGVIRAAERLL